MFNEPKIVFDTQNVGVFPHFYKWLSMYASLTEHSGRRKFWYADRKTFVLGRRMTR